MNVVMFYHSLRSDWNHGNAHFLRGVVAELQQRGHAVRVYEPRDGWSLQNLTREHGDEPVRSFRRLFPRLWSRLYCEQSLDLDEALHAADASEMGRQMERVLTDADTARTLAGHGLERVRSRHTCAHRVDELLAIYRGGANDKTTANRLLWFELSVGLLERRRDLLSRHHRGVAPSRPQHHLL